MCLPSLVHSANYTVCLSSQKPSVVKNLPANSGNAGDVGSIPESGRSPAEGNDNLLQYSWLGNTMDRGAWHTTVHGGAKELDKT